MARYSVDDIVKDWTKNTDSELRLEKLGLTEVPQKLFELDPEEFPITKLSFARNNLKTLSPEFFGKQNKIIALTLSTNKFAGNNEDLVESIRNLTVLQSLDFSENTIKNPEGLVTVLTEREDKKHLKRLFLRKFSMGLRIGNVLQRISVITELDTLDLSECNIHGFPTVLLSLTNLETLDLSFNSFSTIPDQIEHLCKLKRLGLEGCGITQLCEGICSLEKLEVLRLNYNELNALPEEMKKLSNLDQLLLMNNNFNQLPPTLVDEKNEKAILPKLSLVLLQGNLLKKPDRVQYEHTEILCQNYTKLAKPSLILEKVTMQELKTNTTFSEVYLGCYTSAKNKHFLEEQGIKSILIVGDRLSQLYPMRFKYLQFELEDDENESLTEFFKEGTEFIHRMRDRGGVLIHCAAGISRSASMVIAYIIRYQNKSFEEAYKIVAAGRDFIHPNQAFVTQLEAFSALVKPRPNRFFLNLFDKKKER